MGLRDSIASDAISVFANNAEFAETVTYSFTAGGTRSFPAIIDREPPEVYSASGDHLLSPRFILQIPNSESAGVRASEVDTGGDQVSLKAEFGDVEDSTFSVAVLLSQDMGMIQIALV